MRLQSVVLPGVLSDVMVIWRCEVWGLCDAVIFLVGEGARGGGRRDAGAVSSV